MKKLGAVILGTGKLGTDLLIKVLRSSHLKCVAFVGKSESSKGIALARSLGVPVSIEGISFLESIKDSFDLVFDVTNACSHLRHWPVLKKMGKTVIDLTPSHIGHMVVPVINLQDAFLYDNLGLISCGGQSSLPIIHTISQHCANIQSIEVVSSIASKSAGPGTRINIDEYIQKTEDAIRFFSKCQNVKAVLILNPAEPEIYMKTTIYVEGTCNQIELLDYKLQEIVKAVQIYVPGYEINMGPVTEQGIVTVSTRIKGRGDFLPPYAGNLDIINCAAIRIAEALAGNKAGAELYAKA